MQSTPDHQPSPESGAPDSLRNESFPEGTPIGSRWELPSDHLPIAARVGSLTIASWNVLNKAYIHHLRRWHEGLANARLVREDVRAPGSDTLTVREVRALGIVRQLTDKFDIVLLQECSSYFLQELQSTLPAGRRLVSGRPGTAVDNICAIINLSAASVDEGASQFLVNGYPNRAERPIMNMMLVAAGGERLRLIHSHVPGDPRRPGLPQFARYAARYCRRSAQPVIVAGDLNFPEDEVRPAFREHRVSALTSLNSLNTILGDDGAPKRIDHILLFGDAPDAAPIAPEEISAEVAAHAALLNPAR